MEEHFCRECIGMYLTGQESQHRTPCAHCFSTKHTTCNHTRLQQIDDAYNAALQRGGLAIIERLKAEHKPAEPEPEPLIYCLNCRRERRSADREWHSAPCQECGSDGHSRCQHRGRTTDELPKQATDPYRRNAMDDTGRHVGNRRDV